MKKQVRRYLKLLKRVSIETGVGEARKWMIGAQAVLGVCRFS
jgi:hypothetical protein